MEILNRLICQYCEKERALGVFRSKWICGKCLLKFEEKINQERNKFLDLVEEEIKNGSNMS